MPSFISGGGGVGPSVEIGELNLGGAKGNVVTFDAAGAEVLISSAVDGDVPTIQADGTLAFEAVPAGAAESLATTLAAGNTTGGSDIVMSTGDDITGVTDADVRLDALGTGTVCLLRSGGIKFEVGAFNKHYQTVVPNAGSTLDLATTGSRFRDAFIDRTKLSAGTEALPAYTFDTLTDDGMYSAADGALGFSADGIERFRISSNTEPEDGAQVYCNTKGTVAPVNVFPGFFTHEDFGANELSPHFVGGAHGTGAVNAFGLTGTPGVFCALRSRGTQDAPTACADTDATLILDGRAYSGSTYQANAQVRFFVDGTPAGGMPGGIMWITRTPAGVISERMRLGSNGSLTLADATDIATNTTTGTKIATATTQKLGFWGATPVVQPAAYTPTNVVTDRSYDANATTLDELADVLGTLIADLQSTGLIG